MVTGRKGIRPERDPTAEEIREAAVWWLALADIHEELLKATAEPYGLGCRLTTLSEAFRRGDIIPDLSDSEMEAVTRYLLPAVNALITEALIRCGATRDDIHQERLRRGSQRARKRET